MSTVERDGMSSDEVREKNSPVPGQQEQASRDLLHHRFPSGFSTRDEANTLVAWAFRNGPIENLHAGKYSALLDDPSLSRITDEEMKALMLAACRQLAKLLELRESDPAEYARQIPTYNVRYCRGWER